MISEGIMKTGRKEGIGKNAIMRRKNKLTQSLTSLQRRN